jgi:hypothetical protein
MRLDCAVMEDVGDGDAALGEAARYQETAMTVERIALGAYQTNARPRRDIERRSRPVTYSGSIAMAS